jgi:2-polyprenyl-6-methoxyphenol hydroxylase-like FAD-dependent oxidoreductase
VGAGPVGLWLAAELCLAGIGAVVFEQATQRSPHSSEVTLEEVRESAPRVLGTDLGGATRSGWPGWVMPPPWRARTAAATFLAGTAAHIHPPQGGQGLNLGVQDAMNLGWKLAAEVNGTAAPWLLDSYERERRPVGEQVVKTSCAQEERRRRPPGPDGGQGIAGRDARLSILRPTAH